jgi:hypothetical protein
VKTPTALTLVLLLACSRGQQEQHAAVPKPPPVDAGPPPPSAFSTAGSDISWLVGTWERQSAPKDWLLFNAPKEVAVIAGAPPAMIARGEFVPTGRSISIFIPGQGGGTVERVLEATPDRSELREAGPPPVTYRRGAPP